MAEGAESDTAAFVPCVEVGFGTFTAAFRDAQGRPVHVESEAMTLVGDTLCLRLPVRSAAGPLRLVGLADGRQVWVRPLQHSKAA